MNETKAKKINNAKYLQVVKNAEASIRETFTFLDLEFHCLNYRGFFLMQQLGLLTEIGMIFDSIKDRGRGKIDLTEQESNHFVSIFQRLLYIYLRQDEHSEPKPTPVIERLSALFWATLIEDYGISAIRDEIEKNCVDLFTDAAFFGRHFTNQKEGKKK